MSIQQQTHPIHDLQSNKATHSEHFFFFFCSNRKTRFFAFNNLCTTILCQTPVKYFYYSGINNYKRNKNRASPVIAFLLISLVNVYTACMCRGRTNPHPGENRSTASIQENLSAWLIKCFFCHLIFLGVQIIAALTQLQGTLALLFFMCWVLIKCSLSFI